MPESTLPYQQFIPRPITDRAYWDRVTADARYAAFRAQIADNIATLPARPPIPTAADFLAAVRHNDRSRCDRQWFERGGLIALALRRCMAGPDAPEPDDRLLDWLWDYLTQASWGVHHRDQVFPCPDQPTLDLSSCELAATFAEMLEVIKPWLDAQGGDLSGYIVHEIDRRVLGPFAQGREVWWAKSGEVNNWAGVCAGTILATCVAMERLGHPRPQARSRALVVLRLFLNEGYTPDAECDEGLGYWAYGLGMASVGWSCLGEAELHDHLDMARLRRVADYPRRIHLVDDLFYSGNDAPLDYRPEAYFVPWLACATGSRWLLEWARREAVYPTSGFGRALRCLDAIDLLAETAAEPSMPSVSGLQPVIGTQAERPSHDVSATVAPRFLRDQQAAIMTIPTSGGPFIATLSGGHNAEGHNHNDLGHINVLLGPRHIIADLGAPHYPADFFGPRRYTYLAASSRGHCCPLIGGLEQLPGAAAAGKLLAWEPDAAVPRLSLDLTAAYPIEAGLLRWTRTLEQHRDRFVVIDQFRTQLPGQKVTHVLWSPQCPQQKKRGERPNVSDGADGADGLRLLFGPVTCAIKPTPRNSALEQVDPAEHHLRHWRQPLCRIAAEYETDQRGELTVISEFAITV